MKRFAIFLLLLAPTCAHAGVDALHIAQTDNTSVLSGYITNDLAIDFTGRLGNLQLLVELDSGEVYNTPGFGTGTPPNDAFLSLFPELAFDTFIATGGLTHETNESGVFIWGGAVNLGGPASLNVAGSDQQLVSAAWSPGLSFDVVADQADFPIARLTLSDNASGTLSMFGSGLDDGEIFRASRLIQDGVVLEDNAFPSIGDFNNDSRVDNGDLNLLLASWGSSSVPPEWSNGFVSPVDNGELTGMLATWGAGIEYGPVAANENGDFNGDGRVDTGDYKLPQGNWGSTTVPPEYSLWIDDGLIDYNETNYVSAHWGEGVGAAVPEPAGAMMLTLTVAAFARRSC